MENKPIVLTNQAWTVPIRALHGRSDYRLKGLRARDRIERLHAVITCPAHTMESLHVFGIAPFTSIYMSGYVCDPMQVCPFPSFSSPSPNAFSPCKLSQRIRYLYSITRTDYSLLSTCKQNIPTIANFHPCPLRQALDRPAGYMYVRQIVTYVPGTCRYGRFVSRFFPLF